MKKLIITEKPSQVADWEAGLKTKFKKTEFTKGAKGRYPVFFYEDDNYVVCNLVGHVATIKEIKDMVPEGKHQWNLGNLPYDLPYDLELRLTDAGKTKLFNNVKEQASREDIDEIIIATDPEREGLNIWRKVEALLPKKATAGKKITRAFPTGPTPGEWADSLNTRQEIKTYWKNFVEAAIAREDYDYIVGINGTVGMTSVYGGFNNVINVGRVQTAVLKFLYDREMEIKNFIPEDFSTVNIKINSDESENVLLRFQEPKMADGKRFDKNEAIALESELSKLSAVPIKKEVRTVKVGTQKLYTQSTLAKELNRRYGMSAKKVLTLTQSLYETHKLTSYPRTSVDTITEARAASVSVMLSQSFGFESHVAKIKNPTIPSEYIFKGKVAEHEAITPVSVKSRSLDYLKNLSADERKVYDVIVSRFVSIFFPPAEKESTTVTSSVAGHTFKAKGEKLIEEGWMSVDGVRGVTKELPKMTDGFTYGIVEVIKEDKQTTPPNRYNGSTIMEQMIKPTANITDEDKEILHSDEVSGIGTDATRANILDGLEKNNYVVVEGKTRTYVPTEKTMSLFDTMPDNKLFSSPAATAIMETKLEDIAQGNLSRADFMKELNEKVSEFIEVLRVDDKSSGKKSISNKGSYGECPKCKGELYDNGKGISCPNNNWKEPDKSTCDFKTVWKNKGVTKAAIMEQIQLQGKPVVVFAKCSNCGSDMIDDGLVVKCNADCGVQQIFKNRFGYVIPDADIKTLIDGGEITVQATSQAGKPYSLFVIRDKKTGKQTTRPTW